MVIENILFHENRYRRSLDREGRTPPKIRDLFSKIFENSQKKFF